MGKAISEYEVESLYIDRLVDLGYEYVELKNYADVISNFKKQFCLFNKEKLEAEKGKATLSRNEFDRVLNRLEGHTIYESARILREQFVLTLDNGKSVYLSFITNDPEKNIYQVTHQVTMDPEHKEDVLYKNRYDVTILVNGIPVVQTELKRPGVEINEAVNQINRYRKFSFRGLFRYLQIFVVSNSVQTKYFANANEIAPNGGPQNILKSLVFYWTTDDNTRINELMEFTNDFLRKPFLTDMLLKYFVIKESEPVLMVMRPYQIYAVKKAFDRIMMSNLNGYVFHTTGSGKTLTSFKLASLLRDDNRIEKVFFLIDRKDLDDQTVDEYNSFEPGCVDNTEDTLSLVSSLKDNNKKLIVTTIQKMANALRNDRYSVVMDAFRSKKVIFIIDECHRSQFGKMHSDIEKHFTSANYIGFTGTPIFKENKAADGRTTADIFSAGSLEPCIHKYMIKEAIADGNVLRFSVEYMQSVNVKAIDDKKLDPSQCDDPEYLKRHGIDIKKLLHDEKRIAFVADDILAHLDRHTRSSKDTYTAIFATDHINTLMQYYRYMRDHNPGEYKIAAIFTYQPNEDMDEGADEHAVELLSECMEDYNGMFGTKYDITTFDAYRKDIAKRMKQKNLPQIDLLIVVDMFLTGFDSKATNTLILDKNLIWHNLVQAYSRTNRVAKVTKQFGQIITYRNIKKAQDEALKLYSGSGNPNDYLLETYEYYLAQYHASSEDVTAVAATPEAAGHMQSEDDKRQFVLAFRKLSSTLSTLKTFSKFEWKDLEPFLAEDSFMAYKSWYLTFYDEMKEKGEKGENTILADVDFEIELVRTDKINVVYILNLLKEALKKDKTEMEKHVDLVLRDIERSDNQKLRYQKDLMKAFIETRFFELDPDEDIIAAYDEFTKGHMIAEIEEFSRENELNPDMVSEVVSQFFAESRQVTKEKLRQKLADRGFGLLRLTRLIEKLLSFCREMFNKYTAEGR